MKNKNAHTSRFDIAITNPPYCGDLHLRILKCLVLHCEETINISPGDWLISYTARFKKRSRINSFKELASKISDVVILDRDKCNEEFGIGSWTDYAVIKFASDCDKYDLDNLINKDFFEEKVLQRVLRMDNVKNHFREGSRDFDNPYVLLPIFRGDYCGVKSKTEWISPDRKVAFGRRESGRNATINFDTQTEADNFFESLQTYFMRYIRLRIDNSMGISWRFCPFMKDYKEKWTDERFCNHFNLTEEEFDIIKKEIKKIDDFADLQKERIVSE